MKTMTCIQMGGACEQEFHAATFEEMAELSRKHGIEMYQKGDKAHMRAMEQMQNLMLSPETMKKWFESRQKEFEALPEDD